MTAIVPIYLSCACICSLVCMRNSALNIGRQGLPRYSSWAEKDRTGIGRTPIAYGVAVASTIGFAGVVGFAATPLIMGCVGYYVIGETSAFDSSTTKKH